MNINSVIKYTGILLGAIGLIFTAYRIHDENSSKKTIPAAIKASTPTKASAPAIASAARNANSNLPTQAIADLQEKKY